MPKTEPFDKHSDQYDAWFDRNRAVYLMELEAIRSLLPASHARGLEVGVGSGIFAVPLGIRIGVEPSESMAMKKDAAMIWRSPLKIGAIRQFVSKIGKKALNLLRKNGIDVIADVPADTPETLVIQYLAKTPEL